MNQINLDKLLKSPVAGAGSNAALNTGDVKLLVGEMYSARLQTLADAGRLQLQTPQGRLNISLPLQLGQQISQQFGLQMQVSLSPAANNQLNLSLQSLPGATSSIPLNPTQLQPVLSQWLSQQLPQLTKAIPSAPGTAAGNTLTLAVQLLQNSGQLQLAGAGQNSGMLLTLSQQELLAVTKLIQQLAGGPTQHNTQRQPLLLRFEFTQSAQPLQLSLQTTVSAQTSTPGAALLLSAASQQQLLQALLGQLAPVKQLTLPGAEKISLGQLSISIPPQLAANLADTFSARAQTSINANGLPLLLQLQAPTTINGQWQLLIQPAPQSQQLNLPANLLERSVQWQPSNSKMAATPQPAVNVGSTILNSPAAESRQQAWRNLLPLLSQPMLQPNNLPNLPEPLQRLFSQIQQSLPDISKPLAPPVLAAQINALLQFQPLQSQPNMQTAGGTLALAIQLLLGHLSQKQLSPANTAPANRLSQLVSQLDTTQAGTALRQLASLSSPLQQSQLATLDAQSQLQQWLLQLPLQQQGQTILPQLLLEQREADGKSSGDKQKQWQLTMKFDLQQYGNLLAVAKLQQQDLQLQFYTDHNQALHLAEKFLPLLKDRCAAQGLTISKAECQLGKIPDSLLPRHNSLLTVKV
ncbi:flagellar hook-length control protein FliK [Arsukibacterium ikkense]|uniref:flagellar hook-length control protein FliK n=1 Tax=Arsukibacterium ikkense TaxID=336831 RepID=UPI00069C9ADB|nr:flagellar hook-length control protein FliK [Arsukibacterium ikkense]